MIRNELAIQGLVDTINYSSFPYYVVDKYGDDEDKAIYDTITNYELQPYLEMILGSSEAVRKEKRDWIHKETKAIGLITKLVTESYYIEIEQINTPFLVMEKLHELFDNYKLANSMELSVDFYRAFQHNDEDLNAYINRMMNIANKLKEIGFPLTESQIVFKILSSMNEKYLGITRNFVSAPDDSFTIAFLRKQATLDKSLTRDQRNRERKEKKKEEVNLLATKNVCRMFNTPNGCKYGNSCKFQHSGTPSPNNNNNNNNNNNSSNNNNDEPAKDSQSKSKSKKEKTSLVIEKQSQKSLLLNEDPNELIYIDSGSTTHLSKTKFNLSNQQEAQTEILGAIENQPQTNVVIKADAAYQSLNGQIRFKLEDTSYCKQARHHLASVSKICCEKNQEKSIIFDDEKVVVLPKNSIQYNKNEILLEGKIMDGLYAIGKVTNSNSINLNQEVDPNSGERTHKSLADSASLGQDEQKVQPRDEFLGQKARNDIIMLWHRKLGHININDIETLQKQGLIPDLTPISTDDKKNFTCLDCPIGKMARTPYQKETKIYAEHFGDVFTSDLYGPIKPRTINGCRYNVVYIDAKTRESFIFQIKKKSHQFRKFKELVAMLELQRNVTIKRLHADFGGEYTSTEFSKWLKSKGIILTFNPTDTPQRTGMAERLNRTIPSLARCMLHESNLPKNLWDYAFNYANFIRNLKPMRVLENKSPYQLAIGKDPDLSKLKPFGCPLHYRNDRSHKLGKLEDRANEGYFIGYNDLERTYTIWNVNLRRVIRSRDVIFYEDKIYDPDSMTSSSESNTTTDESDTSTTTDESSESNNNNDSNNVNNNNNIKVDINIPTESGSDEESSDDSIINENNPSELENNSEDDNNQNIPENNNNNNQVQVRIEPIIENENIQAPRYPRRANRTNVDNYFETKIMHAEEIDYETPSTYKEAIESEDHRKWIESMNDELNSFIKMNVFTKVENIPRNTPIIGSRWVYKIKCNAEGKLEKYKSRLVAKGYTQTYGIDYFETFSPVVRYETLRYLLAHALQNDYEVDVCDVNTAFLYAKLNEDVYMRLPNGCGEFSNQVVKLNYSVYGTKQASNNWNSTLKEKLINYDFIQSKADPCLYIKKLKDGTLLIVAVYVDDLTIIGKRSEIDKFKAYLKSCFEIKDLGQIRSLLGINITRTTNSISLDQSYYISKLLKYFQFNNITPNSTPGAYNTNDSTTDKTKKSNEIFEDNTYYRQAVGALNHLCRCTRPDIAFCVNNVAKMVENPTNEDWNKVKRIFQYLKHSIDLKLTFTKENEKKITGYSDSDFAAITKGDDKRKSTSGYVFIKNNAAISWKSKRQPIIATSSMEAEYIALHTCSNEALWLRKLQKELENEEIPIVIYEDNQSAIKLTEHEQHSDRSKHIDIRYHSIRERITNNQINVKYIPTAKQTADVLTKALKPCLHQIHAASLGLTY